MRLLIWKKILKIRTEVYAFSSSVDASESQTLRTGPTTTVHHMALADIAAIFCRKDALVLTSFTLCMLAAFRPGSITNGPDFGLLGHTWRSSQKLPARPSRPAGHSQPKMHQNARLLSSVEQVKFQMYELLVDTQYVLVVCTQYVPSVIRNYISYLFTYCLTWQACQ